MLMELLLKYIMKQHKSDDNIRCNKCKGLIILDYISWYTIWLKQLRCLNCGWTKLEDAK